MAKGDGYGEREEGGWERSSTKIKSKIILIGAYISLEVSRRGLPVNLIHFPHHT